MPDITVQKFFGCQEQTRNKPGTNQEQTRNKPGTNQEKTGKNQEQTWNIPETNQHQSDSQICSQKNLNLNSHSQLQLIQMFVYLAF